MFSSNSCQIDQIQIGIILNATVGMTLHLPCLQLWSCKLRHEKSQEAKLRIVRLGILHIEDMNPYKFQRFRTKVSQTLNHNMIPVASWVRFPSPKTLKASQHQNCCPKHLQNRLENPRKHKAQVNFFNHYPFRDTRAVQPLFSSNGQRSPKHGNGQMACSAATGFGFSHASGVSTRDYGDHRDDHRQTSVGHVCKLNTYINHSICKYMCTYVCICM